MICFLSFLIHVATYMKSWISLHWPCKSHALFLCSSTLLSSSSSAHTFPLSLFGAGLPLQVIGGRGATGRPAQGFHTTPFFRGQILDTFLRGSRWPNGSILEVKMEVKFDQIRSKNASTSRTRFPIDFWSIFDGPGPAKVCKTHRRSFKNQEIDLLRNMLQNSVENEGKILPKRGQNP